jgi:hypothetical protein
MPTIFQDTPFKFSDYLEELGRDARRLNTPLYDHWVKVYDRLSEIRNDHQRARSGHLDANIDLILRCLENEQAEWFKQAGKIRGGGALFLQEFLSRSWILSSYEVLRATPSKVICEHNKDPIQEPFIEGFCCRLCKLKKDFALIRMPLAKFEPANFNRKDQEPLQVASHDHKTNKIVKTNYPGHGAYHPPMATDQESGSIGWSVYVKKDRSARMVSRRDLSDAFLALIP